MIRKLGSGQYRLYLRKKNPQTGKRRNLGTFTTPAAARKDERGVQYFKRHEMGAGDSGPPGGHKMAKKKSGRRRYSPSASKDVESAMRRRKRGTLRSGKGGKGGKVTSRKQAIAIALSEARKKGKKVPRKRGRKRG